MYPRNGLLALLRGLESFFEMAVGVVGGGGGGVDSDSDGDDSVVAVMLMQYLK